MSGSTNATGASQEALHQHFRNVCKEFKKIIGTTREMGRLDVEFDRFINVSRNMNWSSKPADPLKKAEGEKALSKVIKEYKRYAAQLHEKTLDLDPYGLVEALSEVELLAKKLRI